MISGREMKNVGLSMARRAGMCALARWVTRGRSRILAYHGVDPLDDPVVNFDGLQVRPDVFRRHLEVLDRHFEVVSLSDIADGLRGSKKLGPGAVAITFDDGYRNNLAHAAPLLKEFGFPATFFVTTGFIDGEEEPWWYKVRATLAEAKGFVPSPTGGRLSTETVTGRINAILAWEEHLKKQNAEVRNTLVRELCDELGFQGGEPAYSFMSWEDVRALAGMGFEIGAHTMSHVSVGAEEALTARKEIAGSIKKIEQKAGIRPKSFAFPYGRAETMGAEARQILEDAGIEYAVTTMPGLVRKGDNPYMLKRLNVTGNHDVSVFEALVSGMNSW